MLGKAELLYKRREWAAARALCEQAQALAVESELREYIWQSRLLAVKLDFAIGDKSVGLQQLVDLLAETKDETEQAALYYERWQLTRDGPSAEAALKAYQRIYERVPSFFNKRRLEALQELQ
jgi:hypothetical protein